MSKELLNRCRAFLSDQLRDAVMRGTPHVRPSPDDLQAFVVSEIGRASDERFDSSVPLCLYFENEEDRAEFVEVVTEAKPEWVKKRWPR